MPGVITGYELLHEIYQGRRTVIYQARHSETEERVLIKKLQAEYPPLDEIARFKREYSIASEIDSSGIVKPLALIPAQNGYALVLEDFGGESLHGFMERRRVDINLFLEIALQLVRTVGDLHQHNIIHKDIKPHNIIRNSRTGVVKLTDFGIASRLSHERQELLSPVQLEGTLAYMSPEQTGRMNRPIDYRTDFYSLGVTFYEMLTGRLPFLATDPVELIHSHIAKRALAPHSLHPRVPQVVSELVMKCLAKNAEDRYQSAYGLLRDLQECRRRLLSFGKIEWFALGEWDQSELFQIPEKLYGREQEVARMLHLFENVCQGASEALLISGHSGIGKSFLVHEITRSIVRERGFFIRGKFDQYKRHIPYAALIQALKHLIQQLLTESEQSVRLWREKLLQAIGVNGQVLIEVIPELELILGRQPNVPQLTPYEAQNRFQLTMRNLLAAFTTQEHPLVLFLDDLQWADQASLKLLEFLLSAPDSGYLLFIGGYRDHDVDGTHRMNLLLDTLQENRVSLSEIVLAPLTHEQIGQWIADTCHCQVAEAFELTDVVMRKTDGNPFFVKQFLTTLHGQGLLFKEYGSSRWQWNLERIARMEASDNVVDFMIEKIIKLPACTQDVLQIGACIGNRFDLPTLLTLVSGTPEETAKHVLQALEAGLILPVGTEYKVLYSIAESSGEMTDEWHVNFQFVHDRVQQAAYSLLGEARRQEIHLRIGQRLRERKRLEPIEDYLFEMVNHLNQAASLHTTQDEREQLAWLNLLAGTKAKSATAYEALLKYLTQAIELLAEDAWQSQYPLTYALYRERSEAEYLCGNFCTAEKFFDQVLANSSSVLEKAEVCNIKVILYTNQARYQEAVEVGLDAMRMLGFPVSVKASKAAIIWEFFKARWRLRSRNPSELLDMPPLQDEKLLEAQKILTNLTSSLYIYDQDLLTLLTLKSFNLSLQHGYSMYTYIASGYYGICLGVLLGDWEGAYQVADVAIRSEKYHRIMGPLINKVYFGAAIFYSHWKQHLRESFEQLQLAYDKSLEVGDLLYASYSVLGIVDMSYLCSMPLDDVQRTLQKYSDFLKRTRDEDVINNLLVVRGLIHCLLGENEGSCSLDHDHFSESEYVAALAGKTDYIRGWYYQSKLNALYLFEDYERALPMAEAADRCRPAFAGRFRVPETDLFYALTLTAIYPDADAADQRRYRRALHKITKRVAKYAADCPANHLHRYKLIQAESARINGERQLACDLYDEAIAEALENQYLQHAAIATECAARFYLELGKERIARMYLMEARHHYLKWGALAKVKDLDRRYGLLLATTSDSGIHSTTTMQPAIDLLSVVKASRAISGEIVLEQLLQKMIEIVVENAGAEKGYLLIERDGQLLIQAEKTPSQEQVRVLQALPYQACADLPQSIIQYVRRLQEDLVLHDAVQSEMFARDPYIASQAPKSLLCMPIINQGRLIGILYVENQVTAHAFTTDRCEVMKLLASQIAVSMENATLFQHQVDLNAAYGKFVPHQFLRLLEKKNILDVSLGDHIQMEMSVLFSDIRSFTTYSETLTPEENFLFVNEYLSQMEPLIIENGGFIDKYIGDSIMSLFDKGADDAVQAALAMLRQLNEFNLRRQEAGKEPILIGIGINTGSLMLGILGGHSRMESTVISDAVNLASRIEGLTRIYGVTLLISEHTVMRLKDPDRYHIRILDRVKVKGKSEVVAVYEVFDADPEHLREGKVETKPLYEAAFALYHAGEFGEAQAMFEQCLAINPQDRASQIYVGRCQRGHDHWQELIEWQDSDF